MATQNNHPEHSDVEASVVEHSFVSKTETATSTPSPSLETAMSVTGETPVNGPVEATTAFEQTDTTGTQQAPQEEQESNVGIVNIEPVETLLASTQTQVEPESTIAEQAETSSEESPTFSYSLETLGASLASSLVVEEEVRPFTDFIEEFRQAESRFNSSLQDYQQDYQRETASLTAEDAGAQFTAPDTSPTHEQAVESSSPDVGAQFIAPAAGTETTPPPARPVSPLLRPASPRLRVPRHGSGRQREEPPVERSEPIEPSGVGAQFIAPKAEPAETQPIAAEEQARPARRYRFDRPAATPPVQSRAEENRDAPGRGPTAVPVRPDNGHVTNGQTANVGAQFIAPVVQSPEQNAPNQPAVQEPPVVEGSNAATVPAATPDQDRRRRHGQERQRVKTQTPPAAPAPTATAIPVAETATATPEPVTPVGTQSIAPVEVNPEDLPPLEYSELQKANTRRRRRRHTGSPTTPTPTPASAAASTPLAVAPKAVTPEPPAVPVIPVSTPSVVVPRTPMPVPTNTAVPATQFTITSGYTVNQMNQTQGSSGPFMGPDPSPARGSTAAQNVRAIRTDVQRTPSYPVRTTEATSASVHQLASVVSQALQTQTDRMVAELRRANQSPTNISVSLPPFPSNERVGVFVDVANLLYSARTLRMTVDFGKLLDFLRGNRRLIRAQAYCPTSPQAGDEQMFLQAVKGLGYRITTKNYKTFSSGAKKADLDLDLCMDVVRLVDGRAVDCIVLVSGDSDFMPMLDYCSDHGVRVEVAAFDEAMSATLRQGCDLFINLSMLEEIRA